MLSPARRSAVLRGLAALEGMLGLIADPDGSAAEVARRLVDHELDLRELAAHVLRTLREGETR